MKRLYRNFSGVSALDPIEFDNWLETSTTKVLKHNKLGKTKLWSDTENIRTRKKKRDARSYS